MRVRVSERERDMMNLLHNIPRETYLAHFPNRREVVGGARVIAKAGVTVCAEDPGWDATRVPELSLLCIRTLARFFGRCPSAGLGLQGRDRAIFLDTLSTDQPIGKGGRRDELMYSNMLSIKSFFSSSLPPPLWC